MSKLSVHTFAIVFSSFVLILSAFAPAHAVVVLHDHFDDGVLDPGWALTLTDATGQTSSESGSSLTVTDIGDVTDDVDWAVARWSRSFDAVTDFSADIDVSWDSFASDTALMYLFVRLRDTGGNQIAMAGYYDPWSLYSGGRIGSVGGVGTHTEAVFGTQGQNWSGASAMDVTRVGDLVSVYWDNVLVVSGLTAFGPLSSIDLEFASYRFDGHRGWPPSTFGTLSTDLIHIEGTLAASVPAPGPLALLTLGFAGLGVMRTRRTAVVLGLR